MHVCVPHAILFIILAKYNLLNYFYPLIVLVIVLGFSDGLSSSSAFGSIHSGGLCLDGLKLAVNVLSMCTS